MPRSVQARDTAAVAALCVAAVVIPLVLAASAGAVGVPGNDDWIYMRAASSLFHTGTTDLPPTTAAFWGQLLMVQPLLWLSGGDPWAFTAFGLLMAAVAVACTYLLARSYLGTESATLVVLTVVLFPGFARESASFMTDVPAYALAMLCLLLGSRWLRDDTKLILFASLGAGLCAVSIRQFTIAAPIAVLAASWARGRMDERTFLAVATGLLAAGLGFVLILPASTPGHVGLTPPTIGQLLILGPLFATLAAVLLPIAALTMGPRLKSFSSAQILVAAAFGCFVAALSAEPFVGNLWTVGGLGEDELLGGRRDPVLGVGAWFLSRQLALFATILLVALLLRWCQPHLARVKSPSDTGAVFIQIARRPDALLILFLSVYVAELAAYSLVGPMFDRYLYPIVPVGAILLLGGVRRTSFGRSRALSHAALAWLAVSAFAIAANSFAYDAARYRAGQDAVAMGYQAQTVDAGLEWVGYHSAGIINSGAQTYGLMPYDDTWLPSPPCAVLSNSPLDDPSYRLLRIDRLAYQQYLFLGPAEPLYLYGAISMSCPQPPSA